jgi:hypothetical protein
MSRILPRIALLLGSVLALSACSTGPQHADTQLSQMYKCNGENAMNTYSECDKPNHLSELPMHHSRP